MQRIVGIVLCALVLSTASTLPTTAKDDKVNRGLTPVDLIPGARFDSQIPTQEEVLGLRPATRPLRHAELMRYLHALVDASPRATLIEYSRTHEGRELVYLAIGEPDTIAGLEDFRTEHNRRLDPRAAADGSGLDGAKAVAWLAYGIHGDELSSVDAAAVVAYWLVAGEDETARNIRRDLVVLIDPMENPDGRDRYLAQTASFAHKVPNHDSDDLSHTTVWPWGRGNHYLFDLNRDWFSQVQPESERSSVIASWSPQLMVDSHEMGEHSTYLFSPARHPFNPHLPPSHDRWGKQFASDQGKALDKFSFPYFTGEWNEEFFPGYGSSWASYHGAVGILYEMSQTDGTQVLQRSGNTRTYGEAVKHQVTSSRANLETLRSHRSEILQDYLKDRRSVVAEAGNKGVGAWVLPRREHADRTDALVTLLRRQGIEVLRATATVGVAGLRDALTGKSMEEPLAEGDWMIPMDQPAARLARVILNPHVPMQAPFFQEEREYLERRRGSRLYDTTSWSLILSYGVPAYWTGKLPSRAGFEDAAVDEPRGSFTRSADAVGYLMDVATDRSVNALSALLQRGVSVSVAQKPFAVAGMDYGHGSLLIARENNEDDFEEHLAQVAEQFDVTVKPTPTGLAESGPDLGGSHFQALVAPRIGVWSGSSISAVSYGAIWHLLDETMGQRFSALDLGRFGRTDLSRYNVLVFPPGSYRQLSGGSVAQLKRWIEAGGTAIGLGSGAEFLADESNELTSARLRRQALDRYPPVVVGPSAEEAQAAGPFRAVGLKPAEPEPKDDGKDDKKKSKEPEPAKVKRSSPYDVAPMLGPGAAPFAAGHPQGTPVAMKPVALRDWLKPYLAPGKSSPDDKDMAAGDARLRRFGPQGCYVRIKLDSDVWLNWGLPSEMPALVRASDTLVAESPVQVAAQFAELDELHLGGLLWPEAAGRLASTAYLTRESKGRGQIILFLNEPEFRGWTLGTRRLLQNAILMGPGLGSRWSNPW